METTNSTASALRHRYFAWAASRYARMPAPLGHDAERVDRWLYSRDAVRFWLLVVAGFVSGILALHASGVSWTAAIVCGSISGVAILFTALGAWLQPERYTAARLVRFALPGFGLALVAVFGAFLASHAVAHGGIATADLSGLLATAARRGVPALLVILVNFMLLLWSIASMRRARLQEELAALRIANERDAIARELAEARLRMLQRQIEPHFIFNTLAAVQHWVDRGDPRAGPMLRALTTFLRGSTESLTHAETRCGDELRVVRAYLAVMSARLGDRLGHAIDVDPVAEAQALPPGLVLTLVENAIEHGIAPAVRGGTVTIAAHVVGTTWTLRVADDGVGLASGWRDGIGLANCRERLANRFGARAALAVEPQPTGTRVTLTIEGEAKR